ncbi:MAG: ABC transporter substrate-binding protein [Lentisphaeria bacterium]|nr:ABC transporter substrate-binding protein [Lentisphaeria bacterium]
MQNKSFLTPVLLFLCLIVLTVIGLGVVTAIDRQRFQTEALTKAVSELSDRIDLLQSRGVAIGGGAEAASGERAGNAEFFDPNADQGGRLILAITSDTGNMNSIINNDATVSDFWGLTFDALAVRHMKAIDRFVPQMAESWSLSDDKLTYHVKLRKGILWHDFTDPETGKRWENVEVTAEDFKFFVDVIKDETVNAAPLRSYFADLKDVRVLNDYEFEVVWERPYILSEEITLGLTPLPRHFYHAYEGPFDGAKFNDDHVRNRMIVGCGPYQFDSWEKGKRVVFKRFEKYYGRSLGIMPAIKTVVYDLIQHPNTRLQALKSQTLDADSLTTEQWVNNTDTPEFGEDGILRKMRLPSMSFTYIGLNLANPLFQDRNVRIALSHLVDRKRLMHDVYHDLVRPVSGPFFTDSSANDPGIEPYEYDVEKAKKMLAEAGWKDTDGDGVLDKDGKPFQFTVIYTNSSATDQKLLPILKEDFARAGVKLEILSLEWSVLLERIDKRQFDAVRLAWRMSISNDPYQIWHSDNLKVEASSNFISFANPEADRLIMEIRTCFDQEKRTQLYHEFHRLIHEEEPYLFLFTPYDLFVINRRYENVKEFPLGIYQNTFWVPKAKQMPVPGL